MKAFFKAMVIVAAVLCTTVTVSAQDRYVIDRYDGRVYYDRYELYDVDVRTFKDLGYGYAKDRNHVYYLGEILEYVDPTSFRVSRRYEARPDYHRPNRPVRPNLPDRPVPERPIRPGFGHRPPICGHHYLDYLIRGAIVFYGNDKVVDANFNTFQPLTCGYAKDAFNVYWGGKKVKGANVHSFSVLSFGYAKDAFNVYWHGMIVKNASPATFRVTSDGYAEDAFNSYYEGRCYSDDDEDDDDDD